MFTLRLSKDNISAACLYFSIRSHESYAKTVPCENSGIMRFIPPFVSPRINTTELNRTGSQFTEKKS